MVLLTSMLPLQHIYVAIATSSKQHHVEPQSAISRLTHSRGHHDLDASYSPDGTKIVFASDRLSSNASLDLFTMNADGSNIKRVATGLTVGGCPDQNCVTPSWGPKTTN